ncbi:hypothetical protein MVEN_00573900 [Mycena venus]|uniref:Uncharacterized protein n=1 Tax=Mycena venus TaxID=2733690 RepID=A0A8H7D4T4_9AGAR|nr:hypothetical protein MVEN_00573900 [Mycena venus]
MLLRQSLRCCPPLGSTRLFVPRLPAVPAFSISRPESTFTPSAHVSISPDKVLYRGPLTATFKRLKVFSLSSLALCLTITPVMFAIESNLPWSARAFLACTAIGTSSVSTAVIAWAGRSYVTALRLSKSPANDAIEQIEFTTLTLRLRPRITRVYDPLFVVPIDPPSGFAKWELAQLVLLPPHLRATPPAPGTEETVAETTDAQNRVLGRWVVRWGENGEGACHEGGNRREVFQRAYGATTGLH